VPRIAFKAKGSILLLDLADIVAVQAEGNYVSLQHRPNPYLVHESLSSMAEKLKPFGFIRIHRSVVVNISAVEVIQPLPTGEYRLCVKGGKEYLVTRKHKHNLRAALQLIGFTSLSRRGFYLWRLVMRIRAGAVPCSRTARTIEPCSAAC
jgi:DNA-binding LytR/AlgR family response regulator